MASILVLSLKPILDICVGQSENCHLLCEMQYLKSSSTHDGQKIGQNECFYNDEKRLKIDYIKD